MALLSVLAFRSSDPGWNEGNLDEERETRSWHLEPVPHRPHPPN